MHRHSVIHYPQEGKYFQNFRDALDNLSVPRACLWCTTSLKQAMGNSSSMGKHRKAQRQHPTHHLHSWAGVTGAQGGSLDTAQQIRANSENYNRIKFAKTNNGDNQASHSQQG